MSLKLLYQSVLYYSAGIIHEECTSEIVSVDGLMISSCWNQRLDVGHSWWLKPSAQRNETKTKQVQDSYEAVVKLFWKCFVSVSLGCTDSFTNSIFGYNNSYGRDGRKEGALDPASRTFPAGNYSLAVATMWSVSLKTCHVTRCFTPYAKRCYRIWYAWHY